MSTMRLAAARRWTTPLLASAILVVSACGGGGYGGSTNGGGGGVTNPPATPVVTTAVAITGSAFSPPDIQVVPSAAVTFTNNDGFNHNVTFTSTLVTNTGNFATGTKSVTLPATAGTYAFHCTIHPSMTGSIKVQ